MEKLHQTLNRNSFPHEGFGFLHGFEEIHFLRKYWSYGLSSTYYIKQNKCKKLKTTKTKTRLYRTHLKPTASLLFSSRLNTYIEAKDFDLS
jgi:hypothetical protein